MGGLWKGVGNRGRLGCEGWDGVWVSEGVERWVRWIFGGMKRGRVAMTPLLGEGTACACLTLLARKTGWALSMTWKWTEWSLWVWAVWVVWA